MSTPIDATLPLSHQHPTDWRLLQSGHHNVLIEGHGAATRAALLFLEPHLPAPIVWKRPSAPFEPPVGEPGTLILEDAGVLSAEEQARLLAWLDVTAAAVRVVSTSGPPLFALVTKGLFDARLYYRLNVLLVHVGVGD